MKEHNLNAINGNSLNDSYRDNASSEIPLKDKFFMSDLEKYYKYGQFPYMLFLHLLLVIITTSIIILSLDDLSLFRYHMRTLESTFMPDPQLEPDKNWKRELVLNGINDLNTHMDFVISKIYDFENCFTHSLKLIDLDKLSLNIHPHHSSYMNKTTMQLPIRNKDDNPLKNLSNEELRKFITHVYNMIIPLKYEMRVINRGRKLNLIWNSYLIFDFNHRGLAKFNTVHNFKYKKELKFYDYIYRDFVNDFGILNVFMFILSVFQTSIIVRKIYSGYKALLRIKKKLDRIIEHDEEEEDSILNEDGNKVLSRGKTKWEMLKLNDKRKFFSLWYLVMLTANFFQMTSSVNHIFFPVLNETNQFLCGTSCFLSWLGCGYFLQYEERYYFFYLTVKKSIKSHYKHMIVFLLIFSGYAIMMACTFHYSEVYYSSLHMSFITCFASVFGDSVLTYWRSTMPMDPFKTVIFAFFFFLIFVAFFLRMMITITEESFDCIKMRKSFYWLDNKISVRDYIKREINFKSSESNDDPGEKQHYMMSNALMNILMSVEKYSDKMPVELQEVFQTRITHLKNKGKLHHDEVERLVKKDLKKFVKESQTKQSSGSQLDEHDFTFDLKKYDVKFGKTETVKMQHIYEVIDQLFNSIDNLFKRLDEVVKSTSGTLSQQDYLEIVDKTVAFSDKVLHKLTQIRLIK